MRKAIRYIKKKLPPFVKRPVRDLFDRIRGLTTTSLTHVEIAALIKKPNPTILEIGCNDGSDTLAFLRVMPQGASSNIGAKERLLAVLSFNRDSNRSPTLNENVVRASPYAKLLQSHP